MNLIIISSNKKTYQIITDKKKLINNLLNNRHFYFPNNEQFIEDQINLVDHDLYDQFNNINKKLELNYEDYRGGFFFIDCFQKIIINSCNYYSPLDGLDFKEQFDRDDFSYLFNNKIYYTEDVEDINYFTAIYNAITQNNFNLSFLNNNSDIENIFSQPTLSFLEGNYWNIKDVEKYQDTIYQVYEHLYNHYQIYLSKIEYQEFLKKYINNDYNLSNFFDSIIQKADFNNAIAQSIIKPGKINKI